MQKKRIIIPIVVFVAGIVGMLLRRVQVMTIFDAISGLAERNAPVSIALVILTVVVIALIVVYSLVLDKIGALNIDRQQPFPIKSKFVSSVMILIGFIVALGSVANLILDTEETNLFKCIFAILGIGSGVAIITGAGKKKMSALSVIPALFMCYWLVITYKEQNTNPVFLEYCYRCLAAAAATLGFYYAAGHTYGKITPKRTVITLFLGAYFCLVTVLDAANIAQGIMLASIALLQLIMGYGYIADSER